MPPSSPPDAAPDAVVHGAATATGWHAAEYRIGLGLSAIFGLRMLGLFLILPVFALHAPTIPGGDDKTLVGLALGIYGGIQACLQVAWGAASDRLGRKPVIVAGLLLFALGSAIAALATDISGIIIGRAVQGAGAISAAITALAADLIDERRRTRVMAMIGSSIGLVFALSMAVAAPLFHWLGMAGMFWLTGLLALGAIALLIWTIPTPFVSPFPRIAVPLSTVLVDRRLATLNFGVFALHATQMALWVLVPHTLRDVAGLPVEQHWFIYLPAVLIAIVAMVPAVIAAEKWGRMRPVFLGAILLLLVVLMGLALTGGSSLALFAWLTLFFVAFNILEATQPSLISRLVSPVAKGKALGVYNTLQALGLFVGGAVGGWLAQGFDSNLPVLGFCGALVTLWLILAARLELPCSRA